MAEFVGYEVINGVAEITLNRPPVNAITMQLTREVNDAYVRAKSDDAARRLASCLGVSSRVERMWMGMVTAILSPMRVIQSALV